MYESENLHEDYIINKIIRKLFLLPLFNRSLNNIRKSVPMH